MKKTILFLIALLGIVGFSSCSSDDNTEKLSQLTVQLGCSKTNVDYAKFTVKLTESRSGQQFTSAANASGVAVFSVPLGQYDVVAEDLVDGAATMYGSLQNLPSAKPTRHAGSR